MKTPLLPEFVCRVCGSPIGSLHMAAGNLKCGWPARVQVSDCAPEGARNVSTRASDREALIAKLRVMGDREKGNVPICLVAADILESDVQPTPATNDEWLDNCPQSVRDFAAKISKETKALVTSVGEVAQSTGETPKWQPIETAPKDNKRPLLIARFNVDGTLQGLDHNASYEQERESWEMPELYWVWMSENGNVEEPTHWMYQPDWYANLTPETQDGQCDRLTAHHTYCRVITEDV